jgi:hypothetical protein
LHKDDFHCPQQEFSSSESFFILKNFYSWLNVADVGESILNSVLKRRVLSEAKQFCWIYKNIAGIFSLGFSWWGICFLYFS